MKNQWIKTKLKLNLYLGMAKQCTKYQMNICKQREKKVRKSNNSWFFSKSEGHNFVKNQWIKAKLKLNLYLGIAKQCTKYKMIDWLIIYSFTSRSKFFHLYGDVTIAGEGLQNLGLCSALRAFEQGGVFIVPHLLWHGASVFPVSSEGPPHFVASYDTRGGVEELF
jgi:hypothetical protein